MFEIVEKLFSWTFLKFCIVGATGTVVDFGATYICKEKLHIQKYIANAIGFVLAASSNYLFNRIWTFHSTNPNVGGEYLSFFAVSLIGLGLNTLIIWLLSSKLKQNFYLAKVVATGIVMLWNYFANAYITFVL